MRGDLDKLSTPERLDRVLAMSELRRTHLVERVQAIKALYSQLTPEQQRLFDAEAMISPHRHRHHHPRRHS
jgi:periplasmic protein CpxP/Spy